ncbi:MAG: replicative DNA helicase [Chthonomonadales bacterium]
MAAERNIPFDHVPPQSLEMEQATLGAMLIERAAIEKAAEILKPEDFYRDAHRIIFDAILTLAERDEPVDILTVQEQLRSQGHLEAVGGTPYIVQLTEAVPTPASVEYYARIVEEKAILRRLIDASSQIRSLAYADYTEIGDVVDAAEKAIFAVAQRRMGAYFTPMRPLVAAVFEQIEHRSEHKEQTTGLATPFEDLNYATAGFQKADLVILAARPSMGKTSLAMGIAQHVAIRQKLPVAVFSLEMSKEQLCLRMICSEARVDGHSLRTGYLKDEDWRRVGEACATLSDAPIFIDDSPDISALEMRAKCRRLMAEHGLGLVVVDYLQLMRGQRRSDNRTQEIGEISRSLKSLARELRVPVLALAQLSRAVEQRPDKRPMLSDLRESGSIEAEADLVIFIYRDAYYKMKEAMSADLDEAEKEERRQRGEDKVEEAELIIAKQRNGPTGKVMVAFHPHYLRFDNLARMPGHI